MIKKILASRHRKRTRKNAYNAIHSAEIRNNGIVNVHCHDTDNVGDLFCAPHNYFDKLKNTGLDLRDYYIREDGRHENYIERISNSSLIIGGGGLLNRNSFDFAMSLYEELALKGKKTVLWGVGHNSKKSVEFGAITQYNVDVENFGLAGTRDYSMPGSYIPCVSCMHPIFDREYHIQDEIGLIFHKDTFKNQDLVNRFEALPYTSNTADLDALIQFIGSKEAIITDSYHAMYWSMLLEKKVAVVPNSSKFYDFKYNPIFTTFTDCLSDIKKAEKPTGILEESRNLNHEFYDKVGNYLNL